MPVQPCLPKIYKTNDHEPELTCRLSSRKTESQQSRQKQEHTKFPCKSGTSGNILTLNCEILNFRTRTTLCSFCDSNLKNVVAFGCEGVQKLNWIADDKPTIVLNFSSACSLQINWNFLFPAWKWFSTTFFSWFQLLSFPGGKGLFWHNQERNFLSLWTLTKRVKVGLIPKKQSKSCRFLGFNEVLAKICSNFVHLINKKKTRFSEVIRTEKKVKWLITLKRKNKLGLVLIAQWWSNHLPEKLKRNTGRVRKYLIKGSKSFWDQVIFGWTDNFWSVSRPLPQQANGFVFIYGDHRPHAHTDSGFYHVSLPLRSRKG